MLIRCTYCGKPVYISGRSVRRAECGFCYQTVQTEGAEEITCDSTEWQEPIRNVLLRGGGTVEKTRIWLRLIGEPEEAERAASEKIRTIREAVERGLAENPDLIRLKSLREQYLQLPEEDRSAETLARLEKEIEKEKGLETDRIREELKEAEDITQTQLIINRLNRLGDYPGVKEMLREAEKRLAELKRRKEETEERIRLEILRRARRRKAIKGGVTAAAILLLTGYVLINTWVIKPARLETARMKLRNGEYQEAASISYQLKYIFFDFNPKVTEEAAAIYSEATLALGDEYMAEQKWEEAALRYHAAGNSEKEAEARKKYGDSLAESGDYRKAIDQWEQIPGGEDRVEELIAENVIYQLRQGDYNAAVDAFPQSTVLHEKAIEILERQGITYSRIYLEWGKALMEAGKTQEAIAKLEKTDETAEVHSWIVNLYLTLGREKIEEEKTDEAIEALKKAAELPEARTLLRQQLRIRDAERLRQAAGIWSANKGKGEEQEQEALRMLRRTAAELSTAESVLQFCGMLDGEGLDLKSTFPDGLPFPEPEDVSFLDYSYRDLQPNMKNAEPIDESRPLVLLCRQKDIRLKMSKNASDSTEEKKRGWLLLPDADHKLAALTEEEREYEWRILPELWQRLPENRRAASLEDSTCVLIVKMEYQYFSPVVILLSQIPFYHQTYQLLLWDRLSGTVIPKGIHYKMNSTADTGIKVTNDEEMAGLLSSLTLAFLMRDSVSAQQMELAEPFTFEPVQQYLDEEYERLAGRGKTY